MLDLRKGNQQHAVLSIMKTGRFVFYVVPAYNHSAVKRSSIPVLQRFRYNEIGKLLLAALNHIENGDLIWNC